MVIEAHSSWPPVLILRDMLRCSRPMIKLSGLPARLVKTFYLKLETRNDILIVSRFARLKSLGYYGTASLNQAALAALSMSSLDLAREYIDEAIEIEKTGQLLANSGYIAYQAKDFGKAIDDYAEAIAAGFDVLKIKVHLPAFIYSLYVKADRIGDFKIATVLDGISELKTLYDPTPETVEFLRKFEERVKNDYAQA